MPPDPEREQRAMNGAKQTAASVAFDRMQLADIASRRAKGSEISTEDVVIERAALADLEMVDSMRSKHVASRRVSDITREEISWLWPGRFPLGKVSMLVGDPGLGKSLATLYLAATVSRGGLWPVRGEGTAPKGDVVLVSAEDDAADTIRPRLEAVGADLNRIHVLDGIEEVNEDGELIRRSWSLADLPELGHLLARLPACKLLVIDPISAYLAGTDSHKNADVRTVLAPLADLAAKHRMAVVCVSHLNKSQSPALYRTTGSLAFVACARAVFCVAKDKDDGDRRLVIPIKSNLAAGATGTAYRIGTDETGTPRIGWEPEAVEIDAETALAPDDGRGEHSERDEAAEWLTDFLGEGPRASCDVKKAASAVGLAWVTVRRAKDTLGIRAAKTRFDGGWQWTLPKMLTKPEDAHIKEVSTFVENEHLRGSNPAEECQGAEDAHHKDASPFDAGYRAKEYEVEL